MTPPEPGAPDPAAPARMPEFSRPQAKPVESFDTPHDPQWYKRAVFYEVSVRSFADSTGNGTGDLRGLTSRWTTCSGWASTAYGCCPSTSPRCVTAATTSPTS